MDRIYQEQFDKQESFQVKQVLGLVQKWGRMVILYSYSANINDGFNVWLLFESHVTISWLILIKHCIATLSCLLNRSIWQLDWVRTSRAINVVLFVGILYYYSSTEYDSGLGLNKQEFNVKYYGKKAKNNYYWSLHIAYGRKESLKCSVWPQKVKIGLTCRRLFVMTAGRAGGRGDTRPADRHIALQLLTLRMRW